MGRALALIALLLPALASGDAGERVRERLAHGRKLYDELEYRKAVRELAPIKTTPSATRAQRLEALELSGLASFILGDEMAAREAFEDILAIDPGYQLREPSGSPKIRAFFEEVKKGYLPDYGPGRAAIEHDAPTGATAGHRVELDVHVIAGADVVKEILFFHRRRGELAYEGASLTANGPRWRVRFVPPADPTGYVLEYYLEARDLARRSVARVGGPETPLDLTVRAGAASPGPEVWYKRWYVWAGAGAAVLVGGALIGLAVTADGIPSGTLDDVDLGR